jgi:release factor glutamine methyltransferase
MSENQPKTVKTWTVIDIVNWASSYFAEKNIDSPRLKIELILCHLLNFNRIDIYSKYDRPLIDSELDTLRSMVIRIVNSEPIQYVIGSVSFCDLILELNDSVLIPRPETEELVQLVLDKYKKTNNLSILDIGSGSGCIGLTLAKVFPDSHVTLIDFSEEALSISKRNAEKNNIRNVTFLRIDVSKELPIGTFSLIVSNPPYIELAEYEKLEEEVRDHEPRLALTDESDGLTFFRRYSEIFGKILSPDGLFFLEIGYGQRDRLETIFDKKLFEIEFSNDFAGIPRFISGRLKK